MKSPILKQLNKCQKDIRKLRKMLDDPKAFQQQKSNADKLSVAKEWLRPLVRDIGEMPHPTHEAILDRIKQEFPTFYGVPYSDPDRKYTKGLNNLNKTAISEALQYLVSKRHGIDVTPGAIKKRFERQYLWQN